MAVVRHGDIVAFMAGDEQWVAPYLFVAAYSVERDEVTFERCDFRVARALAPEKMARISDELRAARESVDGFERTPVVQTDEAQ
ncbi:hypothetical protein [Enterovirga sp. CN4-39]|uniref:hypothetical protein n=1 Tax=Enterovirga sp. CN4-39 TaxID=3400910 RepID=UPI003C019BDF